MRRDRGMRGGGEKGESRGGEEERLGSSPGRPRLMPSAILCSGSDHLSRRACGQF